MKEAMEGMAQKGQQKFLINAKKKMENMIPQLNVNTNVQPLQTNIQNVQGQANINTQENSNKLN